MLVDEGYTTVFYVAGGNIMHLLNSCRTRLRCVPVIHEVSAVIAAEYFNETSSQRAFALVTAGPGLTNSVTGIAGAWLESRGVLVVGGQVKSSDLICDSGIRQNGIQEVNGVEIVKSICKASVRVDRFISKVELVSVLSQAFNDRPGPVFLEFCLDVQAFEVSERIEQLDNSCDKPKRKFQFEGTATKLEQKLNNAERPLILIGGGVSRELARCYLEYFEKLGIPLMTTWNGADRIPANHPLYFGRPNTWGQRSANIILQQADLVIAIGTRLGLQQTGFNWQNFVPQGEVIQVDIDGSELGKKHPDIDIAIQCDAAEFLDSLLSVNISDRSENVEWIQFARMVRQLCPLNDLHNSTHPGFINPYQFVEALSEQAPNDAVVIPCSSGGAFTTMMQAFKQKKGQRIVTNKGLASMGYGLAGSIGAALANPNNPTILVEGDGGFAQNLQELGTAAATSARLKLFIYSNEGYASIRMTQRNYFDGAYMGCDVSTGLGLPIWEQIAKAYGAIFKTISLEHMYSDEFKHELSDEFLRVYIVPIHPEQTYYPKISSSLAQNGQMVSDPLHLMTPPLPESISKQVFRYI